MDITLLKEFLYIFSWVLIPCIMTACFLLFIVLILIGFKRLCRAPEIDREAKRAYKTFKSLLIKDLGGDKK